jgi:tetratricopeptide (TPR) repeat protein
LPLVISNAAFGGAAWVCHALNLVLHTACTILLYVIARRSIGRTDVAAAAALLFAVHPAPSEAVLWVSDFAGLVVATCTLAALALYQRPAHALLMLPAMALLTLAATLAKESGLLIPIVFVLYDASLRTREQRRMLMPPRCAAAAGALLAAGSYLALRRHALGGILPGAEQLELSTWPLLLNAFALLPKYLLTYAWPFDLNMYHDFEAVTSVRDPDFLAGAAIAAVFTGTALACARRLPIVTFGICFAAQAVVLYLFVRWPQLNAFAERYLYLPSAGLLLAAAAVAPLCSTHLVRRLAGALLATVVAVFVWTDVARTREWKNELSLYTKTLSQSPRAELVRNNLALRYLAVGTPSLGIPVQEKLLEIDPEFRSGWHNLGLLYLAAGRDDDARQAFERSVAQEPYNAASWLNLGYVLDASGSRRDAIEAYFRATLADPAEAKAHYNLAVIALELGQPGNAARALERAQRTDPADQEISALMRRAAAARYRRPDGDSRTIIIDALARGRQAAERRAWPDALAALQTASWFDENAHRPYHFLANTYSMMGRIDEALVSERAALQRAPRNDLYRRNVESLQNVRRMPDTSDGLTHEPPSATKTR